jgi:hypothetical protein
MRRCKAPYVRVPGTDKCSKSPKVKAMVKCRKDKIAYVMDEYKRGLLKAYRSDKPVKNRKQAIAIAINQANKFCGLKRQKNRRV